MRIQIKLSTRDCSGKFFEAVRRATFRQLVGVVLRVISSQIQIRATRGGIKDLVEDRNLRLR